MANSKTPDREELIQLRNEGNSREKIAEIYGVSMSMVKRWIKEMGIPAGGANSGRNKPKIPISEVSFDPDFGMTKIEKAKSILGDRMKEDYRGYLLDGRPVRVDILLSAAGISQKEKE